MFHVIGLERIDYVSKETGRPVRGYRFYVTMERDRVTGLKADYIYVRDEVFTSSDFRVVTVGDYIDVFYDYNKRIIGCNVFKADEERSN